MRKSVFTTCLAAFLVTGCLMVWGQTSKTQGSGTTPSGFSQGEKSGWQQEFPPGWEKKSEKAKKQWSDEVEKRKKNVAKAAKKKGLSDQEVNSATDDFEKAARKGVAPKKAESLVKKNMKKGKSPEELSTTVSRESEKIVTEKVKKEKQSKEKGKKGGRTDIR